MERIIIQITVKEVKEETGNVTIAEAKVTGNLLEAMNAVPMVESTLEKVKAAVLERVLEAKHNNN